jgi:hypothetical protein
MFEASPPLSRAADAEELEVDLRDGVCVDDTALGADTERHLKFTREAAIAAPYPYALAPCGEFVRIAMFTLPPVSSSTAGLINSHIEFTTFAPIESFVSHAQK